MSVSFHLAWAWPWETNWKEMVVHRTVLWKTGRGQMPSSQAWLHHLPRIITAKLADYYTQQEGGAESLSHTSTNQLTLPTWGLGKQPRVYGLKRPRGGSNLLCGTKEAMHAGWDFPVKPYEESTHDPHHQLLLSKYAQQAHWFPKCSLVTLYLSLLLRTKGEWADIVYTTQKGF